MNRHRALACYLSMISAQTLRVCREGKPVPTFPDHALECLSYLQRPPRQVNMTTHAVDEHQLVHGPADRFDRMLLHVARVVQQRYHGANATSGLDGCGL